MSIGRSAVVLLACAVVASCGESALPTPHAETVPNPNAHSVAQDRTEVEAGLQEADKRDESPRETGARTEKSEPGRVRPLVYGPIEGSILKNDAVDLDVRKRLSSDRFDDFMSAFEKENSNNRDAQELTGVYRKAIDESLAKVSGSAPLLRFSCGTNICMGYVRSQHNDKWFSEWYRAIGSESKNIPFTTMLSENYTLPGGGTENRLLFSTQGKGGVSSSRP